MPCLCNWVAVIACVCPFGLILYPTALPYQIVRTHKSYQSFFGYTRVCRNDGGTMYIPLHHAHPMSDNKNNLEPPRIFRWEILLPPAKRGLGEIFNFCVTSFNEEPTSWQGRWMKTLRYGMENWRRRCTPLAKRVWRRRRITYCWLYFVIVMDRLKEMNLWTSNVCCLAWELCLTEGDA